MFFHYGPYDTAAQTTQLGYKFGDLPGVSTKGVDLTGLLGDIKEDWESGDKVPHWGPGAEVPQKPEAEVFFVKLHIIFALKYNKQQLLSLESTS